MSAAELKELRKEVKQCIDHVDENMLRQVYAIVGADQNADWWNKMPDNIKADVKESLAQAARGEVMTHDEVKKKHPQWFTK